MSLERSSRRLARSCTERTDILRTVEDVLVCLTAAHLMFKVRLINALYHYHYHYHYHQYQLSGWVIMMAMVDVVY